MKNPDRPIILNVDDYAPSLYARTRTLQGAGFDVREATNGQQALEMVETLHPEVVILDVNLPDMSGIAVCKRIKANPTTAGVIVLQTSATAIAAVDRTRALEGGADSYLIQPAEPEELIASIRALLRLGKAESALGESEKIWKNVLAATNDAVLLVDEELAIRAANDKAVELYGYSESELIGMTLHRLRAPALLTTLQDQLAQAREQGGMVYETEHMRKNGTIFPVEVSSKPFSIGPSVRYVHAVRDVSERKRTEENLRFLSEASKLLSSSLDIKSTLASVARLAVPRIADWCAIDLLTPEGQLELVEAAHVNPDKIKWARELRERFPVNPAAESGLPQVVRTGRHEFYPEITDEMLRAGARSAEELDIARQIGFTALMIVPLEARGRMLGAITLVSAESGRRFLSSDLEMALELGRRSGTALENARLYEESQEAVRTRDIFVSVASHELKTPVTVIQGYAELLKRSVDNAVSKSEGDSARLQLDRKVLVDRVTRVYNAAGRLTRLLNDLLDISRVQRGALDLQREPVELRGLISRIVDTLLQREHELAPGRERRRVQIELQTSCAELWGMWDPDRMEQVIINLLDNAIKYSPSGGRVEITLEFHEATEQDGGSQAHIIVYDQGIGIPEEDQARLFQPFMRAGNAIRMNLPGTGLGLAITREIVERHGGRIWVESRPTIMGTAFHVLLPATRAVDESSGSRES